MGIHQPTQVNVCWAMDFQFDQSTDTRPIKLLNVIVIMTLQTPSKYVMLATEVVGTSRRPFLQPRAR